MHIEGRAEHQKTAHLFRMYISNEFLHTHCYGCRSSSVYGLGYTLLSLSPLLLHLTISLSSFVAPHGDLCVCACVCGVFGYKQGVTVVGVDISNDMVHMARTRNSQAIALVSSCMRKRLCVLRASLCMERSQGGGRCGRFAYARVIALQSC